MMPKIPKNIVLEPVTVIAGLAIAGAVAYGAFRHWVSETQTQAENKGKLETSLEISEMENKQMADKIQSKNKLERKIRESRRKNRIRRGDSPLEKIDKTLKGATIE